MSSMESTELGWRRSTVTNRVGGAKYSSRMFLKGIDSANSGATPSQVSMARRAAEQSTIPSLKARKIVSVLDHDVSRLTKSAGLLAITLASPLPATVQTRLRSA